MKTEKLYFDFMDSAGQWNSFTAVPQFFSTSVELPEEVRDVLLDVFSMYAHMNEAVRDYHARGGIDNLQRTLTALGELELSKRTPTETPKRKPGRPRKAAGA